MVPLLDRSQGRGITPAEPRPVRGEGDGDDVLKFKRDHLEVWADALAAPGHTLTDETVLIVEEFELVKEEKAQPL